MIYGWETSSQPFSDVFCYNFIGCALKIFRFLNDSRYLSWSLVAYESLVIYESLVEHRTFVLLGSFVLLDSFVLYDFLSYLRFLKCFLCFSFVDVFILPYLSLFVIWQSEHIFDCIFIYFLFYQYITSILERVWKIIPAICTPHFAGDFTRIRLP